MRKSVLLAAVASLAAASALAAAPPRIDPDRFGGYVRELADDRYEGRAPATPGEARTIAWIADQFHRLGLEPAGPNGSYFQDVPLMKFTRKGPAASRFSLGGQDWSLTPGDDILVNSIRPVAQARVDGAPLVFVGYGVHAPERQWDDFKGVDLHGKIMVVLVNDPDFEAPAGHPTHDRFDGQAMTYYGRWTYKFEEAARQGAAGVLIVHETAGAGYPWTTLQNSDNTPKLDIVRDDPAEHSAPVQGWIQRPVAEALFRRAGLDFAALKEAAKTPAFRPVEIPGARFSTAFEVDAQRVLTHNVLARITGRRHPDETLIVSGHWDGLGRAKPDATGDDIYNAAIDNATGVAAVLEFARLFRQGPRPDRTILFASWTAEEAGLLGAEYYATHPLRPLETTVGNVNFDSILPGPADPNIVIIGYGKSNFQDWLERAAKAAGRTLIPDPAPQAGAFYRSDHFPLARRGVPMLFPSAGFTGASEASRDYVKNRYHQPSDAWNPAWRFDGAAQDLQLAFDVTRRLANSRDWPGWNPGSEFGAVREASAVRRR
ncbi:MAG: M28 family peptidase [Caulobacteraceae bacterium]|nr:M28 family peptidase [Caulobacteraceae bacterium]